MSLRALWGGLRRTIGFASVFAEGPLGDSRKSIGFPYVFAVPPWVDRGKTIGFPYVFAEGPLGHHRKTIRFPYAVAEGPLGGGLWETIDFPKRFCWNSSGEQQESIGVSLRFR